MEESSQQMEAIGSLVDVQGIRVGHYTSLANITGCTVVMAPPEGVAGVDVRGRAPATRETDLIRPGHLAERVHAILLTGGSAFGLDAASGIMRFLDEHNIGLNVGGTRVPIVPAGCPIRSGDREFPLGGPDAAAGYRHA